METLRALLVQGNRKIGDAIHHFDLPPVRTCPGRSTLCERVCDARTGRYRFQAVTERLRWCYEPSKRKDFPRRVIAEIQSKGVLVLRLHCSGDFYRAAYARQWLEVMKACPRVRFYFYTRSWRNADIAQVLEEMAALRCCRIWYSIDRETGIPETVPRGVRLAHLQLDKEERPELLDLLFVVKKLRNHARRVSLPLLCPHQADQRANCGSCGKCFR